MSHTQGPWIADHVGLQWWVLDSDGNYLCELVNDDEEGYFEKDAKKREGNARLMASAEHLLEALETLITKAGEDLLDDGWRYEIASAKAAIKKARGE